MGKLPLLMGGSNTKIACRCLCHYEMEFDAMESELSVCIYNVGHVMVHMQIKTRNVPDILDIITVTTFDHNFTTHKSGKNTSPLTKL